MKLTIVVAAYQMHRELPRTLFSLSRGYQRGAEGLDYQIVVVDNGSTPPVEPGSLGELDPLPRVRRAADPGPSPARAVNTAVRESDSAYVAVVLDGARMVTPGILAASMEAIAAVPGALVTPAAFHLGPDHQSRSVAAGYGPTAENELLGSVGWPEDGYSLFDISVLAGANSQGIMGPITESCFLVVERAAWERAGGLDERFDLPGGGYVSLDLFTRLVTGPHASPLVVLTNEGSFHQVHGGASTGAGFDGSVWASQYEALLGTPYSAPGIRPLYYGQPDVRVRRWLRT